jgi:hypothetical protein
MLANYEGSDETVCQIEVLDIIGECPELICTSSGITRSSFYFHHEVNWR